MEAVLVAGIGIAAFIEFLLLTKKKSAPDWILTAWMFLVLVHLTLSYLYRTEEIFRLPFLLGVEQPLPLLHGVLLYFYVATLTEQLPKTRGILVLHLVPAAALMLYLVHFFLLPPDQKIVVYRNHGAGYETFNAIRWYAIATSGVVYVAWSVLLLARHRSRIREQFSDLEKINLQWLRILTFGLGGIWFLVIFFRSDVFVLAGMVVFVFLIAFFGVRQGEIFRQPQLPAGEDEPRKKYPKSGLTDEASEDLHQKLKRLMEEDGLYKKSDLSINDLSSKLGVHPNYLSQVINQREKRNFYDFVNTYRMEEFKRQIALSKNQQYTLLSLARDCGFSSKSSFNRYFKRATGQTPSEYSGTPSGGQVTPP